MFCYTQCTPPAAFDNGRSAGCDTRSGRMAVTSRSLPQTTVPLTAGAVPGKPRLARWEPHLRFGLFILLACLGVVLISGWGTIWIDDVRYGRPRTMHVAGMVGHHETTGEPTH